MTGCILVGLWMFAGLVLSAQGCGHVCARSWEVSTTASEDDRGPGYSGTLTVGGGLGESECKE